MAKQAARVEWVDYAKGICIVLVVMMHSTLGVEKAAGDISWLHGFIAWAKPFRMPDFFLISGLFLASRIDRPWREFLDSKVLHFAYFYVLWLTLQCLFKAWPLYAVGGLDAVLRDYALSFVEPRGTLWFIYILALFSIAVRLTRSLSPLLVFVAAAALEIAPIETGTLIVDEFAARFVYFFAGYWLARHIFALAGQVDNLAAPVIAATLVIWGAFNGWMVSSGLSDLPWLSLGLGFIGAGAVIAMGVLLSKIPFARPLRYLGENSIIIYLAFFLFMAATRTVLLKLQWIPDLGTVALLTTAAGVIGPLFLYWVVRGTMFDFIFHRPAWAKLAPSTATWQTQTP